MKAARWMLVGTLMILAHTLQAEEVKTYLVTVKINDRVVSEVVKARVAGDLEIASQRMIARIRHLIPSYYNFIPSSRYEMINETDLKGLQRQFVISINYKAKHLTESFTGFNKGEAELRALEVMEETEKLSPSLQVGRPKVDIEEIFASSAPRAHDTPPTPDWLNALNRKIGKGLESDFKANELGALATLLKVPESFMVAECEMITMDAAKLIKRRKAEGASCGDANIPVHLSEARILSAGINSYGFLSLELEMVFSAKGWSPDKILHKYWLFRTPSDLDAPLQDKSLPRTLVKALKRLKKHVPANHSPWATLPECADALVNPDV